jgi:hypothetical protein
LEACDATTPADEDGNKSMKDACATSAGWPIFTLRNLSRNFGSGDIV